MPRPRPRPILDEIRITNEKVAGVGEINLSREVRDALAALDLAEIDRLISKAVRDETTTELRRALSRCGSVLEQKLHYFDKSLEAHRKAKAPRKREQTGYDVSKDASDLRWAVAAMRDRMETERKNGELFYVEDGIFWPRVFTPNLSVRVGYRWRTSVDEEWKFGAITFTHRADTRPNLLFPPPRRKPSPAQERAELQKTLAMHWEHLMRLSLWAVRDYFEAGRDGGQIPETFEAVPDSHSRCLNNFSCDFWGRRESRPSGGKLAQE